MPGARGDIRWGLVQAMVALGLVLPRPSIAQAAPELSMRDFASGQVKKGVRSLGLGGDGATWGNYALVWKDAGTALVDYADTQFSNGNDFHFSAVGVTSPALWNDVAIYVIALKEGTNDVHFTSKEPGLGSGPVAVTGTGSDNALFSKIALPLAHGLSAGVLLSYETSQFDAAADANPMRTIHYATKWRPSGGFGLAWQPTQRLLVGVRALLNTDLERRTDLAGTREGLARSQEFRAGISVAPWTGALLDAGATRLEKKNALARKHTIDWQPNLGFEQALLDRRLAFRLGLDETSFTAGFSAKLRPVDLGVAYVSDLAHSRVGNLFGTSSRSLMLTVGLDYRALARPL